MATIAMMDATSDPCSISRETRAKGRVGKEHILALCQLVANEVDVAEVASTCPKLEPYLKTMKATSLSAPHVEPLVVELKISSRAPLPSVSSREKGTQLPGMWLTTLFASLRFRPLCVQGSICTT